MKADADYGALPSHGLAGAWLAAKPGDQRRFFIWREIRRRKNFFRQLDEPEKSRWERKNKRERRRFKLRHDETLIFCFGDYLASYKLRIVLFAILLAPFCLSALMDHFQSAFV